MNSKIFFGFGSSTRPSSLASASSSSMISLQRSMHSSQMYTPGPAMSFLTCFWLLPQKEHFSRSPPSPMRATGHPPVRSRIIVQEPYDGTSRRPGMGQGHEELTSTSHIDLRSRSGQGRGGLARLEDRVDEAVLDGALGRQDLVALDVAADLFNRPARVIADHFFEKLAHPQDLVGLDLDVGGLS